MINNPTKIKYLLDTNILINFYKWKPISLKLNDFFWSELSRKLKEGKWILLDIVVKEITYKNELKNWCDEQVKNGLVTKTDDSIKTRGAEINNLYEMINQSSGKSTADTYIIAYAEANGLGIFTQESERVDDTELYKIPDVCDKLNIKHTKYPIVFLKEVGFN